MATYSSKVLNVTTATGNSAINTTTSINDDFVISYVCCHFSTAVSGEFTIKIDSVDGSTYDTILFTRNLESETDFVWWPEHQLLVETGSELNVSFPNSTNATYGLSIVVEKV